MIVSLVDPSGSPRVDPLPQLSYSIHLLSSWSNVNTWLVNRKHIYMTQFICPVLDIQSAMRWIMPWKGPLTEKLLDIWLCYTHLYYTARWNKSQQNLLNILFLKEMLPKLMFCALIFSLYPVIFSPTLQSKMGAWFFIVFEHVNLSRGCFRSIICPLFS